MRLTKKIRNQGLHAGAGKESRGVVGGYQGRRGDDRVAASLEEIEILLAEMVGSEFEGHEEDYNGSGGMAKDGCDRGQTLENFQGLTPFITGSENQVNSRGSSSK